MDHELDLNSIKQSVKDQISSFIKFHHEVSLLVNNFLI